MLILFFGLGVYRLWLEVVAVNKETDNLKRKIDETNKTVAELENSKEYLQNPAYLERQARLRLNYKKPDEKVVFVYRSPYNQNPETANQRSSSLFEKIKSFFVKLFGE